MIFLDEDSKDPLLTRPDLTQDQIKQIKDLRAKLNKLYDEWALGEAESDMMTLPFKHFLRKIHSGMVDSYYLEKKFLPKVQDPEYKPDELESTIIEYVFVCLNGD